MYFNLAISQLLYVFEQQTDCKIYLLLLAYSYNLQVHKSIKVTSISMAHTQTQPGPTTVVPKCVSLASDDDMSSLMCVRLELITRSTDFQQKVDKNLKLAQSSYRQNNNRRIRFATVFKVGNLLFYTCRHCSDQLLNDRSRKGTVNYYPKSMVPTK